MDGHQPARDQDSPQLMDEEREMLLKFLIILAVAHIPVTVRIGVQTCKRRRKDGVMDRFIREPLKNFHTVPLVEREMVADTLV